MRAEAHRSRLCGAHLPRHKLSIQAGRVGEKALVGPNSTGPAALHHDDPIGILNRRQPVRDDDDGHVVLSSFEARSKRQTDGCIQQLSLAWTKAGRIHSHSQNPASLSTLRPNNHRTTHMMPSRASCTSCSLSVSKAEVAGMAFQK